jgi:hypothetical protein
MIDHKWSNLDQSDYSGVLMMRDFVYSLIFSSGLCLPCSVFCRSLFLSWALFCTFFGLRLRITPFLF